MRIAVEGCAHGELEKIYSIIEQREKNDGKKVDLLLCCGDFQAVRNLKDLQCMAVSDKYKNIGSFYKYYSGEKVAPVLTIFIGGNHEASNHLQELSYGGWVAPNIYYLGYAGVVNVAGIRIAGFSGIYKEYNFIKGHYEYPPYGNDTIRSVYHIRNLEIFRLKQLSGKIDIFMSHDWPLGITDYGDVENLLRRKSFFRDDIENNRLGSPPAMELLKHHYPSHWFAAHLHCKFTATVTKEDTPGKVTEFLALDKCLPHRHFLQILEIEHDHTLPIKISYDLEWLTILFLTNNLLNIRKTICYMPGPAHGQKWNFTPSEEEKERIHKKFEFNLNVPLNFKKTVEPYNNQQFYNNRRKIYQPNLCINEQTTEFCTKLSIDDPSVLLKHVHNICSESETPVSDSDVSFSSSFQSIQTSSFSDLSYNLEEEKEKFGFVVDTNPSSIEFLPETPLKLPATRNDSLNSSKDSEHSQSSFIVSPLKLPAAKNNSSINLNNSKDSFNNSRNSINSHSSSYISPLKSLDIQNESIINLDISKDSINSQSNPLKSPLRDDVSNERPPNASSEETTSQQNFKKFKRRNQAVYTGEESDS